MDDPTAVDLAAQLVDIEMRLAALWTRARLTHEEIDRLAAEAYDLRERLLKRQHRESRAGQGSGQGVLVEVET